MTTPEITQADRELVHAMIRQLPLAAKMALSTQPSGLYKLAALHRTQARDAALDEQAEALAVQYAQAHEAALQKALVAIRDCMVAQEWPPTDGDRQINEVLAAVRAVSIQQSATITGPLAERFPSMDLLKTSTTNTTGEG